VNGQHVPSARPVSFALGLAGALVAAAVAVGIAGADQLAGALPSPLTPPNRHQPTRSQP
jgi:hypothetical protein